MMHRTGRSYHLPTGGAVYFDTGVIEIATPVIEIEPRLRGARGPRRCGRAFASCARSSTRGSSAKSHTVHLVGFSTHYNVSFEVPDGERGTDRTVEQARAAVDAHHSPSP